MAATENLWLTFQLMDRIFCLPVESARELVSVTKIHHIPSVPEYVRGVIDMRGQSIFGIDLRARIGMTSLVRENKDLVETLKLREKDHLNWLAELTASVAENRQFRLTTDPHACAFGKWYDNYKTPNYQIATELIKFDKPHKTIHALAVDVTRYVGEGRQDWALRSIDRCRSRELAAMIEIFGAVRRLLESGTGEIVIVVERFGKCYGLLVDAVEDIIAIDPALIRRTQPGFLDNAQGFIHGIANLDDKSLICLDLDCLLDEVGEAEAQIAGA